LGGFYFTKLGVPNRSENGIPVSQPFARGAEVTPQALWYEDILDAIRDDMGAIGGPKVLAAMLYPEKPQEAAVRLLLDCLNRDRSQRLNPDQLQLVIREARKAGSFCTIAFICDDAHMTRPVPVEPDDEKARLQREFIGAVDKLEQIKQQLGRVSR
jgi:hypothetical protein